MSVCYRRMLSSNNNWNPVRERNRQSDNNYNPGTRLGTLFLSYTLKDRLATNECVL